MAEIRFDYEPREQFVPFHKRTNRFSSITAHRRCGKTVACVAELIIRALYTTKKNARYAYCAPFYRQARDVAWMYLKDFTREFATKIRESDLRVELPNGAWITLYGSDNPDALRGIYLDGVILDEYGDCRPSLWPEVILPTLSDRKGWAAFIGTAKGKNHFYDTMQRAQREPNWYFSKLPASQTHILDEEELAELRFQMTDAQYAREIECDFDAAVEGTFYAAMVSELEQSGRIHPEVAQYDSIYPVHLVADLGFSDSTAFWFWQNTPDGPNVIDYYENQGQPLQHYVEHLRTGPYSANLGNMWLPHDAKQKTLQTGRGTVEQLLSEGFNCRLVPNLKVQQGIDAARMVLPRIDINATKCHKGIEALRAYRRTFNELTKTFNDKPLHDWASDGADAFRYLALVIKEDLPKKSFKNTEFEAPQPKGYSLDDLYKDRDENTRKFPHERAYERL